MKEKIRHYGIIVFLLSLTLLWGYGYFVEPSQINEKLQTDNELLKKDYQDLEQEHNATLDSLNRQASDIQILQEKLAAFNGSDIDNLQEKLNDEIEKKQQYIHRIETLEEGLRRCENTGGTPLPSPPKPDLQLYLVCNNAGLSEGQENTINSIIKKHLSTSYRVTQIKRDCISSSEMEAKSLAITLDNKKEDFYSVKFTLKNSGNISNKSRDIKKNIITSPSSWKNYLNNILFL